MRKPRLVAATLSACATIVATIAAAQAAAPPAAPDKLLRDFADPPASARPRVWWHWMNGNITKEGIRLDLEWMKRVGIGGVQNFDASLMTPQVVEKRLAYMTPEWGDAFRYATDLAEEKGLELAIAASPGWSETGGPWVKPEAAMKKLVWSETEVRGGRRFAGTLTRPAGIAGSFQDAPLTGSDFEGPPPALSDFYRDVAVIAFPVRDVKEVPAKITVGGRSIDATILSDGSVAKGVPVKFGTGDAASCIAYTYEKPTPIVALTLAMHVGRDFFKSALALPTLEASDDGVAYRKVTDVPAGSMLQHTVSFPATTARHFRVCFASPPPPFSDLIDTMAPGASVPDMFGGGAKPAQEIDILELRLLPEPHVHRWEEKAGFALVPDYYAIATAAQPLDEPVAPTRVLDLTTRMKPDGTLDWVAPPGRWRVLRFGYSLTGTQNHPATPEATGLEVDKFDRAQVKSYLDTYLGTYERVVGRERMGAKGVRALLVDSIEVGPSNWTESLPAEFRRRRGYDLTPWMPALTGVMMSSAADSDRFLYDFRKTLGELISDSHYAQIAASAHERGLLQYGEALEQGRNVLGDDMEMRRHTDIPMAALWTYSEKQGAPTPPRFADIRGAASVAHIYGQNLVAAESLTSAFAPWAYSPRDLKPMIDAEFVLGVNRPVIHTSVHQPLLDKTPGLTLLIFGQMFNRNETWAEQAGAWVTYMARTAHLLQQGRFAADVLYFYGEEAPLSALYQDHVTPDTPSANGFDFASADVVMNRLKVVDHALVTDSGMRYRVLYLGGSSSRMTLPMLKRIAALIEDGATVIGARPTDSPSLSDDQAEFRQLAQSLWDSGRVASGDVDAALRRHLIAPDFEYRKTQPDSNVMFLHRHLDDGEAYFLTNRKPREEVTEARFLVTGKTPQIWRAETGRAEPVSYRTEHSYTVVPLKMAPYESFFVVFREPTTQTALTIPVPSSVPVAKLDNDWMLAFQPGRGAPSATLRANVGSWTEQADSGVRYFSGTATYSRSLKVPAAWKKDSRLVLDLGDVRELAEVFVNGESQGVVWHPPYRVDVSDALRAGDNRIEVRVTNLWVNRLIGDAQPNAQKVTFTVSPTYRADAPLRASGLLGPVTLQRVQSAARH